METVTISFPGQQEASSQAVVSFGTGVGTISIDREVLLRSPVLANTIPETDEDTSDVCAPAGFLHAWLQYLVPALVSADRHQHRDELDDTEYSMESLLMILRVRSASLRQRVCLVVRARTGFDRDTWDAPAKLEGMRTYKSS